MSDTRPTFDRNVDEFFEKYPGVLVFTQTQFCGDYWMPGTIYPYLSAINAIKDAAKKADKMAPVQPAKIWDWPDVYSKNLPAPTAMEVAVQHFPTLTSGTQKSLIGTCRKMFPTDFSQNYDKAYETWCLAWCLVFEDLSGQIYECEESVRDGEEDIVTFFYPAREICGPDADMSKVDAMIEDYYDALAKDNTEHDKFMNWR